MKVPAWNIDACVGSGCRCSGFRGKKENAFRCSTTSIQTLWKRENGQPAPAAGFFRALEWREGRACSPTSKLTARAKQYFTDGVYRYFSPVFPVRP
ncbi:phage protease [Pseudomonas aeruginosa]|uniref:phage protease n=1 Tax=Pseudomonas aeruginosa TaxID=287 RepID=UPI0028E55BDE|nr:phage protease [Pseudomonas aeruginosa]WNP68875.1 phage protease [Pseudomonas aeruginosa]